jgi:hypothetical protein
MSALMSVAVSVFIFGFVVIVVFAASLLCALILRFVPALQGTVLTLTMSDIGGALRRMPIYPTWWRRRGGRSRKPIPVMLASENTLWKRREYLCAFDEQHTPLFTPYRSKAKLFDLRDRFQIETIMRKAEDNRPNVFLVRPRNAGLQTPDDFPPPRSAAASRQHPAHYFGERCATRKS